MLYWRNLANLPTNSISDQKMHKSLSDTFNCSNRCSNRFIEEGTPKVISSFGFHREVDIFKDPLAFKPERILKSSNGEGNS